MAWQINPATHDGNRPKTPAPPDATKRHKGISPNGHFSRGIDYAHNLLTFGRNCDLDFTRNPMEEYGGFNFVRRTAFRCLGITCSKRGKRCRAIITDSGPRSDCSLARPQLLSAESVVDNDVDQTRDLREADDLYEADATALYDFVSMIPCV